MHKLKVKNSIYVLQHIIMIRISIGLLEHENRKASFSHFESTNMILTQVQTMLIVCVTMFYIRANKVASVVGCTINFTLQYIAFMNIHTTEAFSAEAIMEMGQKYLANCLMMVICQIIYMFVFTLMLNKDYQTFLMF